MTRVHSEHAILYNVPTYQPTSTVPISILLYFLWDDQILKTEVRHVRTHAHGRVMRAHMTYVQGDPLEIHEHSERCAAASGFKNAPRGFRGVSMAGSRARLTSGIAVLFLF